MYTNGIHGFEHSITGVTSSALNFVGIFPVAILSYIENARDHLKQCLEKHYLHINIIYIFCESSSYVYFI